jgi:hypothetical protein
MKFGILHWAWLAWNGVHSNFYQNHSFYVARDTELSLLGCISDGSEEFI